MLHCPPPPAPHSLRDQQQYHHLTHVTMVVPSSIVDQRQELSLMTTSLDHESEYLGIQQPEGSALRNVFGSQVSLAELNGDIASQQVSRRGSPAPMVGPSATFQGRQRRGSIAGARLGSVSPTPAPKRLRFSSLVAVVPRLGILFIFGALHGLVLAHWVEAQQFEHALGMSGPPPLWLIMLESGILAVILGVALPLTDSYFPERRHRGKGGDDWLSIVRAAGALLGLSYAVTKLSPAAWVFWGLANPCLWFVVDATRNGFAMSIALSIVGTLAIATHYGLSIPKDLTYEPVTALAAIAAAYFSTGITFGNLGRRLLGVNPEKKRKD